MTAHLTERAALYLRRLCAELPSRCVGSEGNRGATAFFARTVAGFGFAAATPTFDCVDWSPGRISLQVEGELFPAQISPYSPPARVCAPLVVVTTVEELAAAELAGAVALLRGPIAREQLMPKNFPFYNPEEHRRIVALLEAKGPAAIISAMGRDAMAGAVYPAPMFEDGDFAIPSVYLDEQAGARLALGAGRAVALTIESERRPAWGCNVVARRGPPGRRLVICAHIDAKAGTPGALDNAGGTTVLLLLAELLGAYDGPLAVELVALNGEDHYANPGEQLYLAQNAGRFDEIALGINLDGVGYREGPTAYSLYDCSPDLADPIRAEFAARPGFVEGPPWYQGDHSLFLLNRRPALALTSERAFELLGRYIHTPEDRPELVAPERLALVATALARLVPELACRLGELGAPAP
ncbi:MAG TPA: M28 family peptidase [Chloroflexaceae bacterium]|nr:M28 family peptidase [Chloroflexaceae bacterium]